MPVAVPVPSSVKVIPVPGIKSSLNKTLAVFGTPTFAVVASSIAVATVGFGSVVSGLPSPSSSRSQAPTKPSVSISTSAVITAATAPVVYEAAATVPLGLILPEPSVAVAESAAPYSPPSALSAVFEA